MFPMPENPVILPGDTMTFFAVDSAIHTAASILCPIHAMTGTAIELPSAL